MRRTVSLLVAAAVLGTAAPSVAQSVGGSAAIGGAVGAGVGAVANGINPIEGAAIGAVGGAIVGLLSKDKRDARVNYGDRQYGYYDNGGTYHYYDDAYNNDQYAYRDRYGRYYGDGWTQIDATVRDDAQVRDWVLRRYDANSDGRLSDNEGRRAQTALLRIFDTNRDGDIGRKEFARNREVAMRNLQDRNWRY